MAASIETTHERANRLALELDALSAILAAIAAWLAVRAVRQVLQLQEENRQLMERKAAELEQFAGRVAHDVLSPLSGVSLALSLAEKTGGPASHSAISRGRSSLTRVRSVVDALLAFARAGAMPDPGIHASVPEVFAGLEEELRPPAAAENVDLAIEPPPDVAVACSPGVLAILLTNLVRNSLKYMGEATVRRAGASSASRMVGVDLRARPLGLDEGVVGGHGIALALLDLVHVDAEHGGEQVGNVLAGLEAVGDAAAVAGADVEEAVGAELQTAGVMAAAGPLEDDLLAIRVGDQRIPLDPRSGSR